jgi:outer membrane lipoprotein carrier protein
MTAMRDWLERGRLGLAGLTLALASPALPDSGMASALTGAQVVERVQERFAAYECVTARFEKQFVWAALDRTSSRQGRIYMSRPGRFRVELDDGSLLVADGQAIWSYSRRNQQAVVSSYQGELQTPWEVFLDYRSQFTPAAVDEVALGKHDCYLITMQPQSPTSGVAQMKVWVDRKQWHLRQVEQRETSGNLTTYTLSDIRTDQKLGDELFRFVAPDGTEIIDRRPQVGPAGR